MRIGMIWAEARGVIGNAGDLPWSLPEDMARFKAITFGHPVVMGRRTWESFPARFRPLPGRQNIVISRNLSFKAPGAEVFSSLADALARATQLDDEVWIIGGGSVYREAFPQADVLEITDIDAAITGDTRAPLPGPEWRETARDPVASWYTSRTGLRYRFRTLRKFSTG